MKKEYKKPTMEVLKIDAAAALLQDSSPDSGPDAHGKACEHGSHWFCNG